MLLDFRIFAQRDKEHHRGPLGGVGVEHFLFVIGSIPAYHSHRLVNLGQQGSGAFEIVRTGYPAGRGPLSILASDVDGDGQDEIIIRQIDVIEAWSIGADFQEDLALGGVHVLKNSGVGQPTAVMTAGAVPAQYRLGDSYPNPFNPAVVIPFDLATDATEVSLTVYDVLGRRVRQVWQGSLRAGVHRFTWDGRDEVARDVAAGVYLYRLEVDGRVETKKMMKLP